MPVNAWEVGVRSGLCSIDVAGKRHPFAALVHGCYTAGMSKLNRSVRLLCIYGLVGFAAGCGASGPGGGDYTVSITPMIPTNQSPFEGIDTLRLSVLADDGSSEEFDLGAPDSGLTLSTDGIGPLSNSSLLFQGMTGNVTASRGLTEPLTVESGTAESTVLFASVEQVGWIGSLLDPVVGPIVLPVGGGTFRIFGGVGVSGTTGDWKKASTVVQEISLASPTAGFVPTTLGELPTWTDLTGEPQQGWFGSSIGTIISGDDTGKVFIGGGGAGLGLLDPPSVTASVWLYTPSDSTFEALTDHDGLFSPRSEAATVVDAKGVMIMWGGWTQNDAQNSIAINGSVEMWDPGTRRAEELDTFNTSAVPMFDAAGAGIGEAGSLFCGGGIEGTPVTDGADTYGTWATSAACHRVSLGHGAPDSDTDLPVALAGLAMVTLSSGEVLATGGATQGTDVVFDFRTTAPASADAWLYDPDTKLWAPEGSMHVGRVGHRMALLPDGRVLIAGGSDQYAPGTVVGAGLSCVEIYDPTDHSYTPVADCDAGSDASGLAGRAAGAGIALDPDYGVVIAGGSADMEAPQDAINVVMLAD